MKYVFPSADLKFAYFLLIRRTRITITYCTGRCTRSKETYYILRFDDSEQRRSYTSRTYHRRFVNHSYCMCDTVRIFRWTGIVSKKKLGKESLTLQEILIHRLDPYFPSNHIHLLASEQEMNMILESNFFLFFSPVYEKFAKFKFEARLNFACAYVFNLRCNLTVCHCIWVR